MNRDTALSLAIFTLIAFPLFGMLLITLFTDESIQIMIRGIKPIHIQLLWGLGVGLVMGLICLGVSSMGFMKRSPRVMQLQVMFRGLKLSILDCVLISVAVGFGEELFFRGALQPMASSFFAIVSFKGEPIFNSDSHMLLGIAFTSVFFVAIHKYISMRDWRISVYGLIMVVLIFIIGYMTEYIGIWSAAAAHAMIDFILLVKLDNNAPVPIYPQPILGEEE